MRQMTFLLPARQESHLAVQSDGFTAVGEEGKSFVAWHEVEWISAQRLDSPSRQRIDIFLETGDDSYIIFGSETEFETFVKAMETNLDVLPGWRSQLMNTESASYLVLFTAEPYTQLL